MTNYTPHELYINGRWVPASTGETFEVFNPADGELVACVADASSQDADTAVDAAFNALSIWGKLTAKQRGFFLKSAGDALISRTDELARLLTMENGKPLAEARGEIAYAAEFLFWFAEEGKRVYGEIIPSSVPNKWRMVQYQPIGVAAAITPWNFPIAMITRKIAPALAAGCTVVLKPAEQTPLSAFALCRIFHELNIPDGVLNCIPSSKPANIAEALLGNPLVRKITFTGSTEVGKQLFARCADQVKRISLELGGNAPFIVFPDADLEQAVDGVISSKFRCSGQTCICANRLLLHFDIAEEFIVRLTEKVKKLRIGNGLEAGVHIGPLIDRYGCTKVDMLVQDAVSHGARCVCGGKPVQNSDTLKGYFYNPTIIVDVTPDMAIWRHEIFGPVLPVVTFETEEQAVHYANDTIAGLAGYVYTQNLCRIYRMTEALQYGIIGINDPVPSTPECPFGGIKQSGIGREGGRHGIKEYLDAKYISIGI
ncbi:NAD-dependent succinate-semialdehyde dehydrogenase [bacterium]|nr:NAD-dependent succinate-semialdehyde dehydrogenase [bacterium]